MEVKNKIEYYKEQNKIVEETKKQLIDSHLDQINQVIEDKIIALKEQLQAEAIQEVCGEEYNVLNKALEKNNRYIKVLEEIGEQEDDFVEVLKDLIPVTTENGSETAETEQPTETPVSETFINETHTHFTNEDTLDEMMN